MQFDIVTLFPGMFPGYLSQSLLNKAIENGLIKVHLHDLRKWSDNKHNRVDDRPYGGGPGMVLMVEPVVKCVEAIRADNPTAKTILLTPQGRTLNQRYVEQLAAAVEEPEVEPKFILLCGRYEGFDQRIIDILKPDEISVGDFILNGGEVAAMVLVDTLIRMVPGVLGDENSSIQDSFSSGNRMLEFSQYTRPREFRGHNVPEVLFSGNHQLVEKWRKEDSLQKTRDRRADILGDPENLGDPERLGKKLPDGSNDASSGIDIEVDHDLDDIK